MHLALLPAPVPHGTARMPTVSIGLEDFDTGVNLKVKCHVTLWRAVLEKIGNKVRTRATQVSIASEYQSTCTNHPDNKCPQTTETYWFCEISSDKNVGSKVFFTHTWRYLHEGQKPLPSFSDALLCKIEDIVVKTGRPLSSAATTLRISINI